MKNHIPSLARVGWVGCVVCAVALLAGSCSSSSGKGEGPEPQGPSGAELFNLISQTDPFELWGQFPLAEGTIESSPPHGPFSNVFVNEQVEAALASPTGTLPNGSIIVKESFDGNMVEAGDSLAVMWKVEDFDPGNSDWFWANFTFDGRVVAEGKLSGCIICHGAARDNDFVFLQPLLP